MNNGQRTTAVLIDWENLRRGLNEQDYWIDNESLTRSLINAVEEGARLAGGRMMFAGAFAPAGVFDGGDSNGIKRGAPAVEIVSTMSGKNAADTELILRASELFQEGVDHFVIVSGDVDFVPLATYLEARGRRCEIWAISDLKARPELNRFAQTSYLTDLLGLQKNRRPTLSSVESMAIAIQFLAEEGTGIWSYPRSIDALMSRTGLSKLVVEQQWAELQGRGYFAEVAVEEGGKSRPRRRLAYELSDVADIFAAVDYVCRSAALDASRRSTSSRASLLHTDGSAPVSDEKLTSVVDAMIDIGLLIEVGSGLRLASPSLRFGTIQSAIRLAMIFAAVCESRGWSVVGRRVFTRQWLPHSKPGGNLSGGDQRAAEVEAEALIKKARAIGLLVSDSDPKGMRGYSLVSSHPAVRRTHRALKEVLPMLEELPKATVLTQTEFEELLPVGERREADFWLSLLASQRAIRWIRRRDEISVKNLGPTVAAMRALGKSD